MRDNKKIAEQAKKETEAELNKALAAHMETEENVRQAEENLKAAWEAVEEASDTLENARLEAEEATIWLEALKQDHAGEERRIRELQSKYNALVSE